MEIIIIISSIFVFGIIVFIAIHITAKQEKHMEKYGIEADAVVTKVISHKSDNQIRTYDTYVKFMGDDNMAHEALLINVSCSFPYGRKMKIKFLAGKYESCLFISQQID